MRTLLKTTLVNLVVISILLVMLEGAVRLLYPAITPQNLDPSLFLPYKYGSTYGYKPHSVGEEFGTVYVTDEHGFRIAPNRVRQAPQHRVLILGDSVSVGIGVPAEQSYPSLLEHRYPDVRIYNASATGYGISDYLSALASILPKLAPELIIIGFCLNDTVGTSQANIIALLENTRTGAQSPDATRYPNSLVRWLRYVNDNYLDFNRFLKRYSRAYLLIKSLATDSSRDYFAADSTPYASERTADFLMTEFARLRTLAEAQGARVALVLFPYEYQLRAAQETTLRPQGLITAAAERVGIPVYDLYDDMLTSLGLQAIPSRNLYLFNDPMHFNERGHRLIAGLIGEKLFTWNLSE